MKSSINKDIFQLKKVIRDIKQYNKEWRYSEAFDKYVINLNTCSNNLGLPPFKFETFHFSNTGKTINDIGYESLLTHLSILEDMLPNVFDYEIKTVKDSEKVINRKKVFIVHGRDKTALLELEGILNRVDLEPVVLNRNVNTGLTLLEKFEKYSDVQYAIVLLTPDDIGALFEDAPVESLGYKFRARQNVIFELGFFYGKLGRSNVCCILKSTVEKPSDIDGIAYLSYQQSVEEIEYAVLKELKESNMELQL